MEREKSSGLISKNQDNEMKCHELMMKIEKMTDRMEDYYMKDMKMEHVDELYHNLKIDYNMMRDEKNRYIAEAELVLEEKIEEIDSLSLRIESVRWWSLS